MKRVWMLFAIGAVALFAVSVLLHTATRETSSAEPSIAERVAPVRRPVAASPVGADELASHLETLENEARARGVVTDADVRRGTSTIEALSSSLGKPRAATEIRKYGERMTLLRKQLALKPITDELGTLIGSLGATKRQERGPLIAKYRAVAAPLPQRERLDALERLKRFETKRGATHVGN